MPTLEDSLRDIVEERIAAVHKKDPEPLTAMTTKP
jgi:hypothetical protein